MEKFIAKILKAQREKLSKTLEETIGTGLEIAKNNFKAGQKKEREKFIKVVKDLPRSDGSKVYQMAEEDVISRILEKFKI